MVPGLGPLVSVRAGREVRADWSVDRGRVWPGLTVVYSQYFTPPALLPTDTARQVQQTPTHLSNTEDTLSSSQTHSRTLN